MFVADRDLMQYDTTLQKYKILKYFFTFEIKQK